jgi:hypothetical protein
MTTEEWVQAALAARVEQGLPEHIEDPDTLDFLADVLSRASNATKGAPQGAPRSTAPDRTRANKDDHRGS